MKPAYATIAHMGGTFGYTLYKDARGTTSSISGYSAEQVFTALDPALPLIRFDLGTLESAFDVIHLHDAWYVWEVDGSYHDGRYSARPVTRCTVELFLRMVAAAGVPVSTVGEYMQAVRP